jgi:hypothetical protein
MLNRIPFWQNKCELIIPRSRGLSPHQAAVDGLGLSAIECNRAAVWHMVALAGGCHAGNPLDRLLNSYSKLNSCHWTLK